MHSSPLRFSEFRSIGSVTGNPHKRPFTSSMLSTSLLPSRSRNLSTILSQLRHQLFPVTVSLWKNRVSSPEKLVRTFLCYRKDGGGSGDVQAADIRDVDESSQETNVSDGEAGKQSSERLMQKLKRYGVAGVLSYGLLNTAYYLTTFLFVWFYFSPTPGRMGYAAAVKRFLKLLAMVWAGSQVTKILRAGGALALAPFVGRGLTWFTSKFKFETEGKAFAAIVSVCFGLALLFFLILTVLWA